MNTSAAKRWSGAALAVGLMIACGEDEGPPPAPVASAGGTSAGPTGGMVSAGDGIGDGTGSGLPAHCMVGDAETGGADGSETGFKFDVGAPGGSTDFPVSCAEVEEQLTNLGCVFWAVDLPNENRGTKMSPPAAEQQFAVVVANASALSPAMVSIFVGAEDTPVTTGVVDTGGIYEFALDPLNINPTEGSADGVAYRIESDVPITAYQFNPLDNQVEVYSNDASLLLPEHVLGDNYTAVTGSAILLATGPSDPEPVNAGAFVSVVATEDDTTIEIAATSGLVGGPSQATLDRGEVLTVISDLAGTNNGNLSGSRVTADRPVAVFGGNVATVVPPGSTECCADHIEHQLPPQEAWGTAYAVAPPPSPVEDKGDPAVYRITGAFADTELRFCPTAPTGAPSIIQPGETVAFETDLAFTVTSDPDKPFAVTQFLESNGALSAEQPGDPAMIVIPSLGQLQHRYLFAVPAGYAHNYVTIVTRGAPDVTLDGEPVDADLFQPVGVARGQEHAYATVAVDTGAHIVESEVPVATTVLGFDAAVSYGYPGGSGLRVIATTPAG